jgi:D-methionine transport system ATP-binding protein
MIQLIELSKHYQSNAGGVQALNKLNLTVDRATIFGIIGKSGAGKSTLIRCINRLETPTSGVVKVDGRDITRITGAELRTARRQIGMIFQHFNLLSCRTVAANVALPLELMGKKARQIKARVSLLLELTGLSDKQQAYPAQLSGGQKQRVAIARALASDPKLLLCDEATSALDPQTTQTVLDLLASINRELSLTILLISHELTVVKSICHRVGLLHQGKLVEENATADFFSTPQHWQTKKLIQSSLTKDLPLPLQARLKSSPGPTDNPILIISFLGNTAAQPLISNAIHRFKVEINILQANIEFVSHQAIGAVLVEVMGKAEPVKHCLAWLKTQHLEVTVIGYVDHQSIAGEPHD